MFVAVKTKGCRDGVVITVGGLQITNYSSQLRLVLQFQEKSDQSVDEFDVLAFLFVAAVV